MANSRTTTRTYSASSAVSSVTANLAQRRGVHEPLRPSGHRLRAVDRDEVAPASALVSAPIRPAYDVADYLPPGATWLPAPQHTLPALPGRPPMVGYLVLVPADQTPVQQQSHQPQPVLVQERAAEPRQPVPAPVPDVRHGAVRIDGSRRIVEVDGRVLDLTYLEFELLAHLVAHPHRVHTRDQLVTTVWGYGHVGDGRTVDVHIARLRRKLGTEHRRSIQTVRRVGYKYAP
ncbi:winged helix-turn-helix domain-containing protein [Streptomyces sp. NBC_00237]|uniref:winged helix-turn-helix domain-containing protein n=1 Tax=Streptomyces sp. NBC_00237 TaxID=2975687 RepID=UPI00225BE9D1|nr:winged helix-turn-helix domain-containing protein [Streptomyces sp. NBC_00237]MCX5201644.1 winged helix-turn-helix domain-containing protein [Streptomyces sp. NBC_00237]